MSNNTRKVWFVTRPERDPNFHEEALKALAKVTNNFTTKWSRNRDCHLNYEQALIDCDIKRYSVSKDGSGGRTWAALLKTFCYCYTNNFSYISLSAITKPLITTDLFKLLTLSTPTL